MITPEEIAARQARLLRTGRHPRRGARVSPPVPGPVVFTTLAELVRAYRDHVLTAPLMLDNDWAGVYQDDVKRFDSDPETLLGECLALLGVPWEHA
jgi:hypothetical protein